MSLALLVLILALGWTAATGLLSLPNLLLGAVIGAVGLYVVRQHVSQPTLGPRIKRLVALGWLFVRELFISALRVARLVLRRDIDKHLNPAVIAFPLTVTSAAEITLLANMITLTPGTLSVDVSADGRRLYIHALNVTDRDAFIAEIRDGFETKVREALR
jgi:multicomponent Na+:H+ antiporter subunit E